MKAKRNLAIIMTMLLVCVASLPMHGYQARAEQTLADVLNTQHASRTIHIKGNAVSAQPSEGDALTLTAELIGYEGLGYALQWQKDGTDMKS